MHFNAESSNSRGVSVLLNTNFEYNIILVSKDIDGSMIVLDLNIGDIPIKLLSIYMFPIKIHQSFLNILEILLNQTSKLIYFYLGI